VYHDHSYDDDDNDKETLCVCRGGDTMDGWMDDDDDGGAVVAVSVAIISRSLLWS
jgi:hypothetical protein